MIFAVACSTGSAPPPGSTNDDYVFADVYRVGVGDTLTVDVYGHPDVTTTVAVRPDGKITVPITGDVLVGGKIPEEIAEELKGRLSKYIRNPIVTVTVANISSADYLSRVRVTGAIKEPQSVVFRNGMTVMDVVLEAGGVTEFANESGTKLYRKGQEAMRIRLDQILNGRDMSTNVRLRPGDVISIPERIF